MLALFVFLRGPWLICLWVGSQFIIDWNSFCVYCRFPEDFYFCWTLKTLFSVTISLNLPYPNLQKTPNEWLHLNGWSIYPGCYCLLKEIFKKCLNPIICTCDCRKWNWKCCILHPSQHLPFVLPAGQWISCWTRASGRSTVKERSRSEEGSHRASRPLLRGDGFSPRRPGLIIHHCEALKKDFMEWHFTVSQTY